MDGSGRTNAEKFNLQLDTRRGHSGYIVQYTGPTQQFDTSILGAAKRGNTKPSVIYTPNHRPNFMSKLFEQNPLLVRWGGTTTTQGKSFFELPVMSDNPDDITQEWVLNRWFTAIGRYRQNSSLINPGGNQ